MKHELDFYQSLGVMLRADLDSLFYMGVFEYLENEAGDVGISIRKSLYEHVGAVLGCLSALSRLKKQKKI